MASKEDMPSLSCMTANDVDQQPQGRDRIESISSGSNIETTKEKERDIESLRNENVDEDDASSSDNDCDDDGEPSVMDRVLSRVTSKSSVDAGPPPDGGWKAWGVCFAAHLVITDTWGWINSFGSFQTYYTDLLSRPSSDISWIGSITVFLLFFIGTLTGRLVDAGYFRAVFTLGTVLQIVGLFSISACRTYTHFLLAQGICMGVAAGFMFCPVLATMTTYFHRRKALALGIAACGSSTGGLIFPSMVRQLLPKVGFAWTIRSIGFIQLVTLALAHLLIRPRIRPKKGALVDWLAFKELEYTFYAAGAFFCFWGIYFAFYYLAAFSRTVIDPPLSYPKSLDLLLILNGVGYPGRIIPNYIADRVGAINLFVPIALIASVSFFAWMAVDNTTGLYIWAVCYGLLGAGIQSLFPAGLSFLTTDLRKTGVRMGMIFTIVSFAALTGPPIAGAIIDGGGGYKGAQAFAGSVVGMGAGFLFAVKIVKMRKTGAGWFDRV